MKHLLMDSEYCSMGRWISWIVAERYDLKMYEADDVANMIEWLGASKLNDLYNRIAFMDIDDIRKDDEFIKIKDALNNKVIELANQNNCIFHEMAAYEVLGKDHKTIKVMLYCTDIEGKIRRAISDLKFPAMKNASKEEILEHCKLQDLGRMKYHDACSEKSYGMKENYDICINSALFGKEKSAEILSEVYK